MSKFDIPPKVWAPLFAMLRAMWHGQPLQCYVQCDTGNHCNVMCNVTRATIAMLCAMWHGQPMQCYVQCDTGNHCNVMCNVTRATIAMLCALWHGQPLQCYVQCDTGNHCNVMCNVTRATIAMLCAMWHGQPLQCYVQCDTGNHCNVMCNVTRATIAMLCAMWHGQPLVNDDGFCFLTRVIIKFLFLMLTAVLSTPMTTQFSQDTPASEITLSIWPNKALAVDNLHTSPISNNWGITFPFSSSKTRTSSGFIFTSPWSSEPSVHKE